MNNNIKRRITTLKRTAKELDKLDNSGKYCEDQYNKLWNEYSNARIYLDDIANHFLYLENYRDFRIIDNILRAY